MQTPFLLQIIICVLCARFVRTDRLPTMYLSCAVDNAVALTFDDGPSYPITGHVLDTLSRNGIKGTFFICGYQLQYPENVALLQRAYAEGHTIASHSYSHPDFTQITDEAIKREMRQTSRAIKQVIGVKPRLMRAPYG